jgi:trans-aconitate methyltransferase
MAQDGLAQARAQSMNMGCAPQERTQHLSQRYPFVVARILVADDNMMMRLYAAKACASDDQITLLELAGGGHMDFLDPVGQAHQALYHWLRQWTDPAET